jgi:hypothetical protein
MIIIIAVHSTTGYQLQLNKSCIVMFSFNKD